MIIMGSFGGLDYLKDNLSFSAKYSFGNMGFSSSICSKYIINWSDPVDHEFNLMFDCQGTTQIDYVINSGLLFDSYMPMGMDKESLQRCYMTEE